MQMEHQEERFVHRSQCHMVFLFLSE